MQSRTLKTSPLKATFLDLYIFNYNGDQTGFGFNSLPASGALRRKIINSVPTAATVFASDFINYAEGKMLCVNTPALMNKDVFQTFNSVSNTLKFTLVLMPAEFINSQPNQLSSPYVYGERIRAGGSFESLLETSSINGKTQSVIPRNKVYVYRDSNIKGRSKGGQSQSGTGVGVWS